MYETFYGLSEKPFNLTPDPHFLYLSNKHKEAFAHLLYGIKNRSGFVMVTGEIGTGKTTICRSLLSQLDSDTEVSFIFNPCLSQEELLRKINEDFGIDSCAETVKDLVDELNEYLLERRANGKNCVLVIDEAQNLEPKVLEQIRLLSNLETEKEKLLQIILIGQPELIKHLELAELRQLNQRIIARYHLKPLNQEETLQYIAYRLRVAGGRRKIRFTRASIRAVYKFSDGTPRVINALCDRSLLIGYTLELRDISKAIVKRASKELRGERIKQKKDKEPLRRFLPNPTLVMTAILVLLIAKFLIPMQLPQTQQDSITRIPKQEDSIPSRTGMEISKVDAIVEKIDEEPLIEPTSKEEIPEPGEIELAEFLNTIDPADLRSSASLAILRAWDIAPVSDCPKDDSLRQLQSFAWVNGLAHEVVEASLRQLEVIDMPAFTRMSIDNGFVWLTLLGIEEDKVRLSADTGETIAVPKKDFKKYYVKQALVLWRNPLSYTPLLKKPMTGKYVRELQEDLKSYGRYSGNPNGIYDDKTALAIAVMQNEAGLHSDGITGKQTRMLLASWSLKIPTPSLRKGKPEPKAREEATGEAAPLKNELQYVPLAKSSEVIATFDADNTETPLPESISDDLWGIDISMDSEYETFGNIVVMEELEDPFVEDSNSTKAGIDVPE